ncbi:MAG: helical backbone metal receptor [Myxococcota bacterium]|nr:helical backbone metal receptor [Myxococcota bacterium]
MRWLVVLVVLLGCSREEARPAPARGPGSGSAAAPVTTPHRLVSLTPSATEVVAALGATSELVGVDAYSLFPPEVAHLPKVGSFLTPNLEVILGLEPTLVIVDDIHKPAAGALRDAGLATVECPIHSLPDVKQALRTVGGRLGRTAEAERVIEQIEAAIVAATERRPAQRPRVLAVIDREAGGLGNLVAVGPGSWIDELLAIVGAENVLAASGVRYPKISMEEVLRSRPDVILDISFAARSGLGAWSGIEVPAVKTGRVVALSEAYLTAPSPRVVEALQALATAIAPR